MVRRSSIIKGDIAGGTKPVERDIGENLTINNLWDIYRWYPGFKDMISLEVDALYSNGINEDEIIKKGKR